MTIICELRLLRLGYGRTRRFVYTQFWCYCTISLQPLLLSNGTGTQIGPFGQGKSSKLHRSFQSSVSNLSGLQGRGAGQDEQTGQRSQMDLVVPGDNRGDATL